MMHNGGMKLLWRIVGRAEDGGRGWMPLLGVYLLSVLMFRMSVSGLSYQGGVIEDIGLFVVGVPACFVFFAMLSILMNNYGCLLGLVGLVGTVGLGLMGFGGGAIDPVGMDFLVVWGAVVLTCWIVVMMSETKKDKMWRKIDEARASRLDSTMK